MWVIFGVFTTCSVLCLLDERTAFVFRVTELVAVDTEVTGLPSIQKANQGWENISFPPDDFSNTNSGSSCTTDRLPYSNA